MEFTHLDDKGRATMVDVGEKQVSRRTATARCIVSLPPGVLVQLNVLKYRYIGLALHKC